MPDVRSGLAGRLRLSTSIVVGVLAIGTMLLVVGLLADTIAVAFVGFVAVLAGCWRLSLRTDPARWGSAVGGRLRPDTSGSSRPPAP